MRRRPKDAPSTRFVSPCGLPRAWPGAADDARQTRASFRHPDAGRFCWMPGLSVLASDSEASDGQRVSGRVGGSQRGGASARSAKSTSECACVRSMDCFLSAARWQSSASRGRRCGRAATHLRYDAHSGQTYFWMRASSAASMAASASVPAAEEPGVPAMRGPVLVAGVGVAAVGLRALYVSPAPPTVLSPPQTRILPCGNSSSTTRLIPRGVSGCPQGGSSAVPGDFFIPRVAQASCGSAASAGPSVELASRLWSPSASLGCCVCPGRPLEKGRRDEHCRNHGVWKYSRFESCALARNRYKLCGRHAGMQEEPCA